MKTEINSIASAINAKVIHKDMLDRPIHPGDIVAVLISANTKKEQSLKCGIVEITDAKYVKVIDYDTFYTDERFYLGRAITGKQCCIINNEFSKDELKKVNEQFKKPFEKFYSYIFAYKINDDFYCLQHIMLKGKASENTINDAINALRKTHDTNNAFSCISNKNINDLHVLTKDLSFIDVNSDINYSKINNSFVSPSTYKSSLASFFIMTDPIFYKIDDNEHIYKNNWWYSHSSKTNLIAYTFDINNLAIDARAGYLNTDEKLLLKSFINFCNSKTR